MTLQVMWAGNIFFPPLLSQVNSMDFKRTLWIQPRLCWEQSRNMAGWLCTVGVGDILIHICTSACAVLYIHLMNLMLPSRHTSEESHRGTEHQYMSITYCLMYVAALYLILLFMCSVCRQVCIIAGVGWDMYVNICKSMESLSTKWNSGLIDQ